MNNGTYKNTKTLTLLLNNEDFIADLEHEKQVSTHALGNDQNNEITSIINKVKVSDSCHYENGPCIQCSFCRQKLNVTKLPDLTKFHCPSCDKTITLTKEFANYTLKEIIGIGGMAVVYRAFDNTLQRNVAIKILNESLMTKEEHKLLFLKEAQMAARLNHSAILPIYAFDKHDGKYYIVMPYMQGSSLKGQIFDKSLSQDKRQKHLNNTIHWILEITKGLVYSLHHGIVHHDIKPGNILLDKYNNAHLCDFGLAQIFRVAPHKTLSPQFWLSPHYTSPEKVMYRREDYRGDIYSLGATFYHLITGQPPFHSNNIDGLITARFEQKPKNPRSLNRSISRKTANLILNMLNLQPAKRPEYSEILLILSQELV